MDDVGSITPHALPRIRSAAGTPARRLVYAELRNAIVRGELEPGRPISENALANDLGVSRTPIREALSRLRDDRLVEVVPQLGTYVARISPQAVADAQFIREALECASIQAAAARVGENDLSELEQNIRAQDRAEERGDIEAFYLLDDGFHRAICDLSGHPAVWGVSERAKAHLNRIRRLSLTAPDYLPEMIVEHRAVLNALADRDADTAESVLRHHLRMVLREVPRIREQNPEFFETP